jgi:tRNA G18 (ribose-2'-O)-methylase SpoU
MVDAIKTSLKEVDAESQGSDAPVWKQLEEMLQSEQETDANDSATEDSNGLVNFQRKIIPLDSLNLAMEDLQEKRLWNVAGEHKQQLIVCALLVDKVPNLGGLARMADIFAADWLVIPDMAVCRGPLLE